MKIHLITLLLVLSSCASIIQGDEQKVQIKTASGEPAECELTGYEYSENVSIPAEVTVNRSSYILKVDCRGENGVAGSVDVMSDVSGWGYGGAALGLGVGAIVDSSTGAAFAYPEEIIVELGSHKVLNKNSLNSNWIGEDK